MALDGRQPEDLAGPDPRREPVDERPDIRLGVVGVHAARLDLRLAERLDPARDDQRLVDAEAGIDAPEALVEEPREMDRIARRPRGPDPQGLGFAVDPAEDQVEPARADPPLARGPGTRPS